ncbi:Tn3 family transposase [Nonomuraea sp. NPDC005501]|uniref:Tn3 family transposase n=1 Tax=Nonomuraea sp. NPDC005501 TaxID=3156884 RepID=UPI0033B10267
MPIKPGSLPLVGRAPTAGRRRAGLIVNCVIYSTACDITDAANNIAAEGRPVDLDDLATVSPYLTHTVRRFGNWTLDLTPPDQNPTTRLDLEPRVLFST